MATNYTFDLLGPGRVPRRLGQQLVLSTRGFSARATGCARDRTTVQLDTGPDFSGKISAEGREKECSMEGAGRGGNTSYQFIIDHARCGSQQNSSSVWTYVVVQEAGAILTHSTRRFLVLCHFTLPEVFTVQVRAAETTRVKISLNQGELKAVDRQTELVVTVICLGGFCDARVRRGPGAGPAKAAGRVAPSSAPHHNCRLAGGGAAGARAECGPSERAGVPHLNQQPVRGAQCG